MVISKIFQSSQKYLSKLFVNKKENVHLYNNNQINNEKNVIMKERKPRAGTKQSQVMAHLLEHGNITSWTAIELYAATRLSALIFNLRDIGEKNKSFEIITEMVDFEDKLGNKSQYANYIFKKL